MEPPMVALADEDRGDLVFPDEDPVRVAADFLRLASDPRSRTGGSTTEAVPPQLRRLLLDHWRAYELRAMAARADGPGQAKIAFPGILCVRIGDAEPLEEEDADGLEWEERESLTRRGEAKD